MDDADKEIYTRLTNVIVQMTSAMNIISTGVEELVDAVKVLTHSVDRLERSSRHDAQPAE